jgi:signal transduction histidine kinase
MTGSVNSDQPRGQARLQVLIVEDDPDFATLVVEYLRHSGLLQVDIEVVDRLARALEVISSRQFDCVLLDLGLPDSQHLDTVTGFIEKAVSVPVVVITGDDESTGLAALAGGAQDFLLKHELTPRLVERALVYAVERQQVVNALADANRELDHFAEDVAHDMQVPLTAAEGHLRLLETHHAEMFDRDAHDLIDHIEAAHDRMRRLIDDTISFARIRTDRLRLEPVDTARLVPKVVATLEDVPPNVVTEHLPLVTADPELLAQVFYEIIDNGLRYVREGQSPRVTVGATHHGAGWLFSINDIGLGIPEHLRSQAFEAYRRLPSSIRHEGTGLGLAIARKIIERHGGKIWSETNPAGGSTFHFTMPSA